MWLSKKKKHCCNCIHTRKTLIQDWNIYSAQIIVKSDHSGIVTALKIDVVKLTRKSVRCVLFFFACDARGCQTQQKSLSREQYKCFDEPHARKFKSTSIRLKCSHRPDEKPHLNTTLK